MKKLIVVASLLLMVGSLSAGEYRYQSFLNVPSIMVRSNNYYSPTNLLYSKWVELAGAGTNISGVVYTNNVGVQCMVTNYSTGSNGYSLENLLGAAELPKGPVGATWAQNGLYNWWSTTNALGSMVQTTNFNTSCSIFARVQSTNAAASGIVLTMRFAPMVEAKSGSYVIATGNNLWSFPVALGSAVPVLAVTNVPTYLWPGVRKLALVSITMANADEAAESCVTDVGLVSYDP